jgi:hypothetical protein
MDRILTVGNDLGPYIIIRVRNKRFLIRNYIKSQTTHTPRYLHLFSECECSTCHEEVGDGFHSPSRNKRTGLDMSGSELYGHHTKEYTYSHKKTGTLNLLCISCGYGIGSFLRVGRHRDESESVAYLLLLIVQ